MRPTPRALLLGALTLGALSPLALSACGEDPASPPPPLTGPTLPIEDFTFTEPTAAPDGPGHWPKAARGVSLDEEDLDVLRARRDAFNGDLGLLVINRPLLTLVTREACLTPARAAAQEPLAQVRALLEELRAEGVTLQDVVVNVELLRASRTDLYHQCLAATPALFYSRDHRAHILKALTELADLEGLTAITFGVDLNAYYHLTDDTGLERRWDYINLISLYHEVYDALKAKRPDLKVGPGLSWGRLMNQTRAGVAEELALDLADPAQAHLALEVALRRTAWPLLVSPDGAPKADFVGASLTPAVAEAPFNNQADPPQDALDAYYLPLPLLGRPAADLTGEPLELPIAYPQVDWTTEGKFKANEKATFLERVKIALRHVAPLFVSWLRFSDLPDTAGSSKCAIFTADPKLYPKSFCFAGLFGDSGQPKTAWDAYTADP